MVGKNNKNGRNKNKDDDFEKDSNLERDSYLKEETIQFIYSILLFIAALFLVFSSLNKAGIVGTNTYEILSWLLGIGYFLLPFLLAVLGILFLRSLKQTVAWPKLVGAVLFLLAALGVIS